MARSDSWQVRYRIEDRELVVNGDVWLVCGVLTVSYERERDRAYGADADGNRGVDVTGISDRQWKMESARLLSDDGDVLEADSMDIPEIVRDEARLWADAYTPDEGDDEC